MKAYKRYKNKTIRRFRSSTDSNTWNREAWVTQVLKIASLKYNLEPEDFERFVEAQRGKK